MNYSLAVKLTQAGFVYTMQSTNTFQSCAITSLSKGTKSILVGGGVNG